MRKIPEKCDEIKEIVKNKLNTSSAVCLTTDVDFKDKSRLHDRHMSFYKWIVAA
jgi:predicted nucleic acid-binding protein